MSKLTAEDKAEFFGLVDQYMQKIRVDLYTAAALQGLLAHGGDVLDVNDEEAIMQSALRIGSKMAASMRKSDIAEG